MKKMKYTHEQIAKTQAEAREYIESAAEYCQRAAEEISDLDEYSGESYSTELRLIGVCMANLALTDMSIVRRG